MAELLAQHPVRHRADLAIRASGDEAERLTKVDNEMAREHGHVLKLAVNFNLKPRSTGIKDRDIVMEDSYVEIRPNNKSLKKWLEKRSAINFIEALIA